MHHQQWNVNTVPSAQHIHSLSIHPTPPPIHPTPPPIHPTSPSIHPTPPPIQPQFNASSTTFLPLSSHANLNPSQIHLLPPSNNTQAPQCHGPVIVPTMQAPTSGFHPPPPTTNLQPFTHLPTNPSTTGNNPPSTILATDIPVAKDPMSDLPVSGVIDHDDLQTPSFHDDVQMYHYTVTRLQRSIRDCQHTSQVSCSFSSFSSQISIITIVVTTNIFITITMTTIIITITTLLPSPSPHHQHHHHHTTSITITTLPASPSPHHQHHHHHTTSITITTPPSSPSPHHQHHHHHTTSITITTETPDG